MEISVLGSGSSGNSFFIQNNENAILVDAGLSAKQITSRLETIKRSPDMIKGIFITHEHADHIRGADVLARYFNIPIFATKKTIQNSFLCSNPDLINSIKNTEILKLAGMEISAFSKSHKAADPVSFSITNGKTLSIITDAGFACENIISAVNQSDFLCLESNHDEKMLKAANRPWSLKQRIASRHGHLSNIDSCELLNSLLHDGLQVVVLAQSFLS